MPAAAWTQPGQASQGSSTASGLAAEQGLGQLAGEGAYFPRRQDPRTERRAGTARSAGWIAAM